MPKPCFFICLGYLQNQGFRTIWNFDNRIVDILRLRVIVRDAGERGGIAKPNWKIAIESSFIDATADVISAGLHAMKTRKKGYVTYVADTLAEMSDEGRGRLR